MNLFNPFQKRVPRAEFTNSASYWEKRYALGGDSGTGSFGKLAKFKARILNEFVAEKGIRRVVELGCGDGEQLKLARYPSYIGLDISPTAISRCQATFKRQPTMAFHVLTPDLLSQKADKLRSDAAFSLDVLYHLVEDLVYEEYMRNLFAVSSRYVVVYSSNREGPAEGHVRERRFTDWIEANEPLFKLVCHVENEFPKSEEDPKHTSSSDFFFFEKTEA